MSTPRFFSQPLKYLHWAAIEKPAIFYSIIVGSMGPVLVLTVPKIRHRLGDGPRPPIPSTYPSTFLHHFNARIRVGMNAERLAVAASLKLEEFCANWPTTVPAGPRKQLSGYDD
ncbi:hypothetical protein VE02_07491 [Pseudogymnoascus sp. 03VT05]|nr:hypothetical protein VE02_07491 [Pseudogymnoascus sp. 03VT05]